MDLCSNRRRDRVAPAWPVRARWGLLFGLLGLLMLAGQLLASPPETPPASGPDEPPAAELVTTPEPRAVVDPAALREALRHDPELAAVVREEAEREVAAQLAGIPRPRYIPATALVDLKGLEVYASPQSNRIPFGFYLNGFMQVRWFEFARSVTSWTSAAELNPPPTAPYQPGGPLNPSGRTNPVNNINT